MVFNKENPASSSLLIINLVVTTLSLMGSGWMSIYCFQIRNKDIPTKMILTLAISDFFYSISNVLSAFEPDEDVSTMCTIEGFIRAAFYSISNFTTSWIVIYCVIFLRRDSSMNDEYYFRGTLAISILVSLALAFR